MILRRRKFSILFCDLYFYLILARDVHINSYSEIWHKKQTQSVGVDARISMDMDTPATVKIVSIGIEIEVCKGHNDSSIRKMEIAARTVMDIKEWPIFILLYHL